MLMTAATLLAEIEAGIAPAILDVRSWAEFARGHVPGAQHMPFWAVPVRRSQIAASPDDMLVVYCGHGPRAWLAGAVLRRHGFQRVVYLDGHLAAWRQAGFREDVCA
ncbi:MAG: rhodanese-like domain-containing protein [Acidobacteriota bacterium]